MALDGLVHDERTNAVVGWLLLGIVTVDAVENLLRDVPLWGGFELFVVAVASVPALVTRDWTAMVPWPILSITAFAVLAGTTVVPFETTVYLAIASLAFVVVVELEAFTSVRLTSRFAVGFAVLTTLALQALWTIAQFYSDAWLGTDFLRTQTELQWDFVVVTAVGLVLGAIFQWYFVRFESVGTAGERTNGTGSR
ncbi:hypothetical protein Htur_1683 [Haloterrigena turkmenica DSM 5511]|uniref:Lycopene cyclase domain-containing protein n=1 Tax=Haloterrigena turkmenica (strain ATCC 51198 / DSM 5511 / JCM 9101 / NCIMB 13204 / VKM B-1734 / 4k) TaxID=543526 RepID=D2RRK8_HALTV|nr:hypothetical protein [Haloterrigena turkmenica]ADB60568.1 hypothetical protein Htur_1683 [Haloterrigena turkmenica DSM 5511]